MLRPQPCAWFELLALREDLEPVLELLALSGAVELQATEHDTQRWVGAGFERALARWHELARSYGTHWPRAAVGSGGAIADPAAAFTRALALVEAWRADADPILDRFERLAERQRALADLAQWLAAANDLPDPALLAAAGERLAVRVFALAPDAPPLALPADLLTLRVRGEHEAFTVAVGRSEDREAIDRLAAAHKARRIALPPRVLRVAGARRRARLARLRAAVDTRLAGLQDTLARLATRHQLAPALAELARIEWLAANGSGFAATDRLVRVTGWTTTRNPASLCGPLRRQARRCVVHFPAPPAGFEPPVRLDNPPFARGFERFARLLGQPGCNEADPSVLLALFAPLLFGFMFGDVGQGLVLCAAGLWLRRRVPVLALLVPGGLAAMLFGVLFGSVFAREDVLHPLWLNPLHDPVAVLAMALALGAAILLCGLALNALQAYWSGRLAAWVRRDAGFVLAYGALLGASLRAELLWLVPAGVAWFLLGAYAGAPKHRLAALGAGAAQFLEHGQQLLVNTLSFARVGAFALAHAGLSVAVVALADAAGGAGYWIVLALGNVLILALEGLVVGIQTTRLLLFEFFVRFLAGTGRPFKPLAPPLAGAVLSIGESR